MTTSISVHRVKEIRIEKTKLREDSKYIFVEIVVTDDRGQETELNLFGNDHEPISIEATDLDTVFDLETEDQDRILSDYADA